MAIVKLTDEEWYTIETARVLECLKAWLPPEGMAVAEVKARLLASGFGHTDAEFTEIARRLVAGGKIVLT